MPAGSPRLLRDELRRVIDGEVRFDSGSRVIYSTDASNYRQIPIGVIIPRHSRDVIHTVELARENNLPVLARGGGTALGGQTCNTALVIDFSKYMNAAGPVDAERRLITVEPGVVPAQLNRSLVEHGLFFAPDPTTSDRCTIGGMIGNNSCGAHSAAYGKTADNLTALEMLLYDGTRLSLGGQSEAELGGAHDRVAGIHRELAAIRDRYGNLIRARYPKIPRRVSGYNLDSLLPENGFNLARAMVGSEGTLGIILKTTLQLFPRPKRVVMVVLGFRDVFLAADQVPWILEHRPEALEGFDYNLVDFAVTKGNAAVKLLPEAGRAFLIAEFGGDTASEAATRGEHLIDSAKRHEWVGTALLSSADEQQAVWGLRGSGLGSGAFIAGRPRTWPGAEDAAVPPARLGDFLRRFDNLLQRKNLRCASYYGHFGEGCVHCRINFDFLSAQGVAIFRNTMMQLADLVAEFGGSLSGEHGDGIARSELLPKIFGTELIDAFREFKRVFDPHGRMNPGNIVDPHPIDSHLRITPSLNARPVATHFDFSAENGLAGAAMKCVGIGKCRKIEGGTMCPSFMATREEKHSTRGRARLLFEALTGDGLSAGFDDPALKDALDLCLSCKACKSECPAGVDMA
ncbi:MAG: FAD-binding and (Fe-S)-binding domain-containing protein, partial [Candidatus Binataceae bacterium]